MKSIFALFLMALFVGSVGTVSAQEEQGECGKAPAEPEIVDGSTAAMQALVDNSKAVNAFIAEADKYLDCRESFVKQMGKAEKNKQKDNLVEEIKALTKRRNAIGDEFNAQVAAYRKANPEQ